MNNNQEILDHNKYNKIIVALSVAIPIVVAILFGVKLDITLPVFLPPIYATTNAITALVLLVAVFQIKKGNRKAHEKLIKFAIVLSVLFLLMYVLHHMTSESTKFGDSNKNGVLDSFEEDSLGLTLPFVYYFILITHILLSVVVIPFVLITYVRAITNNIEKHKKIAKITFPLWLYVAVTRVIVYLMISPYY